jgi:hypothetical protein
MIMQEHYFLAKKSTAGMAWAHRSATALSIIDQLLARRIRLLVESRQLRVRSP